MPVSPIGALVLALGVPRIGLGPVNHTAITSLLETTIHASRPAPRADGTAISDADHRTTTMLAITGVEPGTTAEAMRATQIVAANGMRLLDAAAEADATSPEKRRLAPLALGFLRFPQSATHSLEKRQAVRRKDDLDFPTCVAVMRRTMEDELKAFKREWERTHQPAAAPAEPPPYRLAAAAAPHGWQHPMHQFVAPAAPPKTASAPLPRRRPRQRSAIRMVGKHPMPSGGAPLGNTPCPAGKSHAWRNETLVRRPAQASAARPDAPRARPVR